MQPQQMFAHANGVPSDIVLIRHPESLRNDLKKGRTFFTDAVDRETVAHIPDWKTPLSEEGERQAQLVAPLIRAAYGVPDVVFHSGFVRTLRMTNVLLDAYEQEVRKRIAVRHDHAVRERAPGYAFNLLEREAKIRYPWLQEYWKQEGSFMACPPGGESLAMVADRVRTFIKDVLCADCAGKKVFIVTHGGTIRCFRFLLERWSYDQEAAEPSSPPRNCGVTHYAFDPKEDRLVLRAYDRDLLSEVRTPPAPSVTQ